MLNLIRQWLSRRRYRRWVANRPVKPVIREATGVADYLGNYVDLKWADGTTTRVSV